MDLQIDPALFERAPGLTVLGLAVDRIDAAASAALAAEMMVPAAEEIRRLAADAKDVPAIEAVARWRTAYETFGMNANRLRSSLESLCRVVASGKTLSTGTGAVDLYNAVSLTAWAPIGGYDAQAFGTGRSLALRPLAQSGDRFVPLHSDKPDDIPKNAVGYASGSTVYCLGFNYRDSADAPLHDASSAAFFFSEAVLAAQHSASQEAMRLLAEKFKSQGARVSAVAAADRTQPGFALDLP